MTGDSAGNGSETSLMENPANNTMDENFSYGVRQNMLAWPVWPGELSDPVAWSAQFIDPSQISQFSGNLVSGAQVPFYTQMNDHN
jgi:hypothetical protein